MNFDMTHYIDAEKLLAALERQNADKNIIQPLIRIIDSLQQEQSEVDLGKELKNWRHEHFCGERDGHYSGEYLERSSQLEIASHFYELGRNQVLQELYKGKIKPFDKIAAVWLDDEQNT